MTMKIAVRRFAIEHLDANGNPEGRFLRSERMESPIMSDDVLAAFTRDLSAAEFYPNAIDIQRYLPPGVSRERVRWAPFRVEIERL